MRDTEPVHVYVSGSPDDPRTADEAPNGIVVHRGPPLHPDDVVIVGGIPTTSVARTLIDLAEVCDRDELRRHFIAAQKLGLLDLDELASARSRVEWRPSLAMLDELIASFAE